MRSIKRRKGLPTGYADDPSCAAHGGLSWGLPFLTAFVESRPCDVVCVGFLRVGPSRSVARPRSPSLRTPPPFAGHAACRGALGPRLLVPLRQRAAVLSGSRDNAPATSYPSASFADALHRSDLLPGAPWEEMRHPVLYNGDVFRFLGPLAGSFPRDIVGVLVVCGVPCGLRALSPDSLRAFA